MPGITGAAVLGLIGSLLADWGRLDLRLLSGLPTLLAMARSMTIISLLWL